MINIKETDDKAIIYVYGTIGDHWKEEKANRAKEFAQALDDLTPKALEIRVDSPGGDVFEGFAIASAIERYEGETHVFVDGMAASAASYIAVMADKVTMNDFSAFMIHNASGIVIGNRDDMRETADILERLDNRIAATISARSGMKLDDVQAAMKAETWYFGDEAKAEGLCDEVIKTEKRGKAKLEQEYANQYKNVPEGVEIVDEGQIDAGNITAGTLTAEIAARLSDGPTSETTLEPTQEDPENDASHALPTLSDNEVKDAAGAILLGNRIYRKEI